MIGPDRLDRISVEAVIPEQIVCYVQAVSGSKPRLFDSCLGYELDDALILIGYPLHDPLDEQSLALSVDAALKSSTARKITVLAATRPNQALDHLSDQSENLDPPAQDAYLALPIPMPVPEQKLRNLLRRAQREVVLDQGRTLGTEHTDLIRHYVHNRSLDPATRHIFQNIPAYIAACPGALVVSAKVAVQRLAGFVVGDFTSHTTAMYMFAFRNPDLAPPGTADLLLHALLKEGEQRGQQRMNLGLGINPAIRFFKQKWGATTILPYLETSWQRTGDGWIGKVWQLLGLKV